DESCSRASGRRKNMWTKILDGDVRDLESLEEYAVRWEEIFGRWKMPKVM
ncbi:5085_t:CDS:1, partial [Paraglomus brasilianum]